MVHVTIIAMEAGTSRKKGKKAGRQLEKSSLLEVICRIPESKYARPRQ
jgi:hypothetical protein